MKLKNKIKKALGINKTANKIFNNNKISWKDKFDLIFCDECSMEVFNLIDLEYYDPDTSYKDDVTAFVNAFNEKMEMLKTLLDVE